LFVEERLTLGGDGLPTEIKVHVFCGVTALVWTADRPRGLSRSYLADGTPIAMRDLEYPPEDRALAPTPQSCDLARQAADLAVRIAGDVDHLRVDFMVAGGRLYFGETTVYSAAGFDMWFDADRTHHAETLWDLRASGFLRQPRRGLAGRYATALHAAISGDRA
jgi:hypothetical protein